MNGSRPMFQVRVHGRGGQGVVTAAEPDALIVQDPTLLHQVDLFGGIGPDGYVLINSSRGLEELGLAEFAQGFRRERLMTVPASEIARAELGRPLPNAALLGGFAALTGALRLDPVTAAIRGRFPGKVGEGNAAAAEAVATGVAAALKAKGREDIRVVGQGGDGGTVDIGLGCLSGMFERGDDALYICYDNEAYMNTGVQRSGATPPAARRASSFDEVVGGLDESNALFEARRCLSCGNCFSCDNCYGVCPDNAVIKLGEPGERYEIDLDFCKGCGLCVAECPCGAIEMVPEEI